jgi:hypothetical protein
VIPEGYGRFLSHLPLRNLTKLTDWLVSHTNEPVAEFIASSLLAETDHEGVSKLADLIEGEYSTNVRALAVRVLSRVNPTDPLLTEPRRDSQNRDAMFSGRCGRPEKT